MSIFLSEYSMLHAFISQKLTLTIHEQLVVEKQNAIFLNRKKLPTKMDSFPLFTLFLLHMAYLVPSEHLLDR